MKRDTWIKLAASLVLCLCLVSSGGLAIAMTALAGQEKLNYTDRAEDGQSREVSLGIAMGAFRGIFVNFLWMRANQMKEDGKFYEANQLADAITKLQPRFPSVWVFHAWNLAYNISVSTQTPEERWAWVNAGIDLLRAKGIPANPNSLLLHKELGWIFLHKIGGQTDDANLYYKKMLAQEWTIAVGPPPKRGPEDRDRAKAIKKFAEWIAVIRDAPNTPEQLEEREPTTRALAGALAKAGFVPNWDLLKRYEMWKALSASGQRRFIKQQVGPNTQAIGAIIDDPRYAKAWPVLIAFVRKKVLELRYHMDPAKMVRYTEKIGPMDWRHHAAHAYYWANEGVENSIDRVNQQNKTTFDFINTDRISAQAVQDLFRSGDLYFDFFASTVPGQYCLWLGVPNPHFVQSYGDILEEMVSRSWADNANKRATMPLAGGYENFIRDAITFFYSRGELQTAEEWRDRLRNFKYMTMNDPERKERLALPLDEYVALELTGELERPAIAVQQVSGALQGAYVNGLLGGDTDLFLKQFEFAKLAHRKFFEAQMRTTAVSGKEARMEQMPSDFRIVAGYQFAVFISTLGLDDAEKVYDRAPDDLKSIGYDAVARNFEEELDAAVKAHPDSGLRSFDAIFPKPKGLDEGRALIREFERKRSGSPGEAIERK
ncbi:MAG: hypothetical protein WC718_01085 [Phycisphaerales bacterium]|jgi:hypothetical protein